MHASRQQCASFHVPAVYLLRRFMCGPLLFGLSLRQQQLFLDGILKSLEM